MVFTTYVCLPGLTSVLAAPTIETHRPVRGRMYISAANRARKILEQSFTASNIRKLGDAADTMSTDME